MRMAKKISIGSTLGLLTICGIAISANSVAASQVNVYRLYNQKSMEHLYTASKNEYDQLPKLSKDWKREGVNFQSYNVKQTNTKAVNRVYNPRSGEHIYTQDNYEVKILTSQAGWRSEGVAFYTPKTSSKPVYRLFNVGAGLGAHFVTADSFEKKSLVSRGWKYEGIAWYNIVAPTTSKNEKPVIETKDVNIKINTSFDEMFGLVKATDKEDGNLTAKVKVKENTVNIGKAGTYKIVYTVTDKGGNTVNATSKVTVIDDREQRKIIASPQGSVSEHRNKENRQFTHADIEPTGIFVKKGEQVDIKIEGLATGENVYATFGQLGTYEYLNDNNDIDLTDITLKNGENNIVFEQGDAMLYIKNTSETNEIKASITGGQAVPMFVLGQTTQSEWLKMLEEMTDAPFVELVGDHVFGTFQYNIAYTPLKNRPVDALLKYWDKIFMLENEVAGLDLEASGVAKKYANRIHIINPDTGAGYANASNRRICFQKDSGAGKAILTETPDMDQWGLWHEIGHTYQTPSYLWGSSDNSLMEVTTNIYSLSVQEKLGLTNRFDGSPDFVNNIREYLANESTDKDFDNMDIADSGDVWVKLGMFEQLRRAYGESFYPRLNQAYRVLGDSQLASLKTTTQKEQMFMRMTSQIAGRNLTSFFTKWGLYADEETKEFVEKYPQLTTPIWNNIIQKDKIVDKNLDSYLIPNGDIKKNISLPALTLGQEDTASIDAGSFLENIRNSDGSTDNITMTVSSVEARKVGTNSGNMFAKLTNSQGISNLIKTSVDVKYGDTLEFIGLGDVLVGDLTLHPESRKLSWIGTDMSAHVYFKNVDYISIRIINQDQEEKLSVAIQGQEKGNKLDGILNGYSYENGDTIEIYCEEPNRMTYYYGDEKQEQSSSKNQIFEIVDDRLVRL